MNEKNGQPVEGVCQFCDRPPRNGETYGTHTEGWDFTNICPECWDELVDEADEEEEDEDWEEDWDDEDDDDDDEGDF